MFQLLKRAWIPLLLAVVVTLGSYVVIRVRDIFGVSARTENDGMNADTKPFNPKHITYEITAAPGGTVNANYLDQNANPISLSTLRCLGPTL